MISKEPYVVKNYGYRALNITQNIAGIECEKAILKLKLNRWWLCSTTIVFASWGYSTFRLTRVLIQKHLISHVQWEQILSFFGKLNRTSYISVPVLHVILRSFLLSVFDNHISVSIRYVMITEDKVNS